MTRIAALARTVAIDLTGIVGAAALTHGVALIYEPAGWMTGGALALAAAVLLGRHP